MKFCEHGLGLCPRARALRWAHVWVRCLHGHVHAHVCRGGGAWRCAQGTQCLCGCHTRVCMYVGPRISICQRVQVCVYTRVSPCCLLLQVGGVSTSFSQVCSLSVTCSLLFCFLQPPVPAPTSRSPSKDSSSSSASALTFQLIPALKAQMFPGTPQACHLGWVLSPCSIFSSVKWTPNSQTRMKGLARDLVYRERWTNATHRDVPSGDNGDDVSLVILSLSRVRLLATPWTAARLFFTISRSLLTLTSTELVMPSNHLIVCCHLLLLTSIFPSIRVFCSSSSCKPG